MAEQNDAGVDQLVDALIAREGGYVNNPSDKGGATNFGITEAVARANGYTGDMRAMPRDEAAAIYRRLYWRRPRFDEVAKRSPRIAAELFDTGVNMGQGVAARFLQQALTELNRNGRDYPDIVVDGQIGPGTLTALDRFFAIRGAAAAESVLMKALECQQGDRYIHLAAVRPANEDFLFGWLANRIGNEL